MTTPASLINLLGFITGLVLYVMLLWIVLRFRPASNRLALLTGILGLVWNAGALSGYGLINFGFTQFAPLLLAGAFGALCFLPSVVVHSALRGSENLARPQKLLIAGASYAMSSIATVMHFSSAITHSPVPSQTALKGLTFGFGIVLLILLVVTRGQTNRGRILWILAISIFATSALHLSNPEGQDSWWLQLAGHHASLPLALLILYQDFRFAFADIFLKRALSFILLAGLIFGMFAFAVTPILAGGTANERVMAILLALWALTALLYPSLRRCAEWLIDTVILKRADYTKVLAALSSAIERRETPNEILDEAVQALGPALSAQFVDWRVTEGENSKTRTDQDRRSARLAIVPMDRPDYTLRIRDLSGARRLLSGDLDMLERAALMVARRIDAVRSMQERHQRDLQEQEMRKLAAEAELRALRAQINPHFLFNALTTIGYLIQTAPERALATLMRLSGLLRGVLRQGEEFVSLGEELDLVEAYLDIERARFEKRLRVLIDVPWALRDIRIPALLIQPLVENAIKHGIGECLAGGEVRISARLAPKEIDADAAALVICVADTGPGVTEMVLARRRTLGLGLANIEQRLRRYGSETAPLQIQSVPGSGTVVEIRVPLPASESVSSMVASR